MGEIKLIRFPNTFRIEFSQKEFVRNKGHYSLSNIEKEMKEKGKAKKLDIKLLKKIAIRCQQGRVTLRQ